MIGEAVEKHPGMVLLKRQNSHPGLAIYRTDAAYLLSVGALASHKQPLHSDMNGSLMESIEGGWYGLGHHLDL